MQKWQKILQAFCRNLKQRLFGKRSPKKVLIPLSILALFCFLYIFLTSSWCIRNFYLPAFSRWTGYRIHAEKISFSLLGRSGSLQIKSLHIEDFSGRNILECKDFSGKIHWGSLIASQVVYLDDIEIYDARLRSGFNPGKQETENVPADEITFKLPELFSGVQLGNVKIQTFSLDYEYAPDLFLHTELKNLQCSGLIPGEEGSITASMNFSTETLGFWEVHSLPIHLNASYRLGKNWIPQHFELSVSGRGLLDREYRNGIQILHDSYPLEMKAYVEAVRPESDPTKIELRQAELTQTIGPFKGIHMKAEGVFSLENREAELTVKTEAELPYCSSLPVIGRLPVSLENLQCSSQTVLNLKNDKLYYSVRWNALLQNAVYADQSFLKNTELQLQTSGEVSFPDRLLKTESLQIESSLDGKKFLTLNNEGTLLLQMPAGPVRLFETSFDALNIQANNACLNLKIQDLNADEILPVIPLQFQGGILNIDARMKADSELKKIAGIAKGDLSGFVLTSAGKPLIEKSRLQAELHFESLGLQKISRFLIPEMSVDLTSGNSLV